ncbi:MAG TPA: EAL domain-containing protein [Actinomycetota bacterium]|nr:EAL domain-containing protein [Actinomycetota bacterium]
MGASAELDALLGSLTPVVARLRDEGLGQETLAAVLGEVGAAVGADRCFVFQNVRGTDGQLWRELRQAWTAAGAEPKFASPLETLQPYFPTFARWIDEMGSARPIAGELRSFPPDEQAALLAEGVAATIQVPVTVGEWWGYVGVDVCRSDRPLTNVDRAVVDQLATAIAEAVSVERLREDEELQRDLYRAMVERGPAATYIDAVDDNASTMYMSPQILELTGYTAEEYTADPEMWVKTLHPDDRVRALAENVRHNETGDRFSLEYRLIGKDGRVLWVHDEARMVRDERGNPRYSHGVMIDVTDRKRRDESVAFQAYHDELTGLPSRAMFEELLDLSIARARRHDGAVAVLCVDLDDFRLVNDSLGHTIGDAMLRLVSERLREATRETDLVARRGGDQFLLLLGDLDRDESSTDGAKTRAEGVARRINASLASPFVIEGNEVYVSAGIGISLFPHDAQDAATIQRNAEAAMYEAKKTGQANYVLSNEGAFDSAAKLQFVTRLRKAVDAQRWTLHYQPVIDLATGGMTGVEALIRWIEPDGTMVPPLEFIPLAEDLGLIEQIGDWVVREIAYQVTAWKELDIDLEVGFNLSPRQFWQPDLAERIVREIRVSGIDPSRVLVEVTESSAMMDPDRAQQILVELTEQGFAIAIDDFGTGYSSLSRLREMPVRVLKIDRSFVSGVHEDPQSASIVTAFLELARGLGMTTLAEGIETADELAFLRERGCSLGQGFYFSKPVPPEEIIAYSFGGIPTAVALSAS